jgi:hypothetical protein
MAFSRGRGAGWAAPFSRWPIDADRTRGCDPTFRSGPRLGIAPAPRRFAGRPSRGGLDSRRWERTASRRTRDRIIRPPDTTWPPHGSGCRIHRRSRIATVAARFRAQRTLLLRSLAMGGFLGRVAFEGGWPLHPPPQPRAQVLRATCRSRAPCPGRRSELTIQLRRGGGGGGLGGGAGGGGGGQLLFQIPQLGRSFRGKHPPQSQMIDLTNLYS